MFNSNIILNPIKKTTLYKKERTSTHTLCTVKDESSKCLVLRQRRLMPNHKT